MRPIAMSDSANFHVSAERIFDPSAKGVPVILLSNTDGCAVARSDEAKALGIKMGDHRGRRVVLTARLAPPGDA